MVVRGRADVNRIEDGASRQLYTVPNIRRGALVMDVDWIELTTGRFYMASATVPLDALQRGPGGAVDVMPVFAPGGVMMITSDPVPTFADGVRQKDVMRICAKRHPSGDHDYRTSPLELPGLFEALQAMGAPQTTPPCTD